ncbi:hypothetical protein GCM10008090_29350 [Arenicella chitinivorans]|uniref:Tail fiber protein n=1 Tax=Arenicella chitinivorans TaxID=1329800 RepID=A0A918S2J7_9GAMM|nr:hypothetical protein [Arenicella chitinivorans]GHA17783.1 hypothetical protein GCM10008090_29350 [Arenicella chitinivorans]
MLACNRTIVLTSFLILQALHVVYAEETVETEVLMTEQVQALEEQVRSACPKAWEDLGSDIPSQTSEVWGLASDPETEADKNEYLTFTSQLLTQAQQEAIESGSDGIPAPDADPLANTSRIRTHCTSARAALLNFFYSNLPQDVVVSMPEMTYEPGPAIDGFLVGDIRHTGRQTAAPGWLFLEGQTIGPDDSGADLEGLQYYELYEIAKHWLSDSEADGVDDDGATEKSWINGDIVTLPDLRGRVVAGASQSNTGGTFGNDTNQITLSESQLPSHNHTINNSGNHQHPIQNGGIHGHKIRSSVHEGSGSPRSDYPYFEGKARPNYQNTIQSAVVNDGNHSHTMPNSGSHSHPISNTGGNQPINIAQPSIHFRVEIKYRK